MHDTVKLSLNECPLDTTCGLALGGGSTESGDGRNAYRNAGMMQVIEIEDEGRCDAKCGVLSGALHICTALNGSDLVM